MKLLITTRSDDRVQHLADISHPIIKEYANKVGADFMILDHEPESDSGDGRPHYRIMKHFDLHEEYHRILHIDTDMIIMPNFPDLFKMVPYEEIATIFEDKGSRTHARRNLIVGAQQKFGFVDWSEGYINTGLFMTSRTHKKIYQKINNEFWTGFGSDDIHLGYLINRHKFKILELSYKFNHMTMFSEPWNNNANRFDSYIIHYAGRGIFDKNVESKFAQMKADYEHVYGKK
jgi:hypothetical protein